MITNWVQTYTGGKFWPLEPQSKDVKIEDIAHQLSFKCRFNGSVKHHLSVAQHSVMVSDIVYIKISDKEYYRCIDSKIST